MFKRGFQLWKGEVPKRWSLTKLSSNRVKDWRPLPIKVDASQSAALNTCPSLRPQSRNSIIFREAAKMRNTQTCTLHYRLQQIRTYLHFRPIRPEDWELPEETMPDNIAEVLKQDPRQLDFFENYWYWRVRSEATVLDPENLPKKSYRQLAYDMGMQVISAQNEHLVGLLELYEYLVLAPCVGPFGTVENPVLIPSVLNDRIVACSGGTGDNEHYLLYFRCREGFLYRCGECDQIFMLVRVLYTLPEGVDPFPVDRDVSDVFDMRLLEKGQKLWNLGEYVHWPAGNLAYKRAFMEGEFGNAIPTLGDYTSSEIPSGVAFKRLTGPSAG